MSATVQALLVFAIVLAATAYATLKFVPAEWRRSFAVMAASAATRSGLSEANARRVEAKLSTGGACGSCDSCKACGSHTKEGDGATPVAASPSLSVAVHRAIPIRRAS